MDEIEKARGLFVSQQVSWFAGLRRRGVGVVWSNAVRHPTIEKLTPEFTLRKSMPLSGEAIRLMNYIDDCSVTLRRVLAAASTLTQEERARVADHLKQAHPSAEDVLNALLGQ